MHWTRPLFINFSLLLSLLTLSACSYLGSNKTDDIVSLDYFKPKLINDSITCGQNKIISATNPCLLINGRTQVMSDSNTRKFDWPGTEFNLKFSGTSISVVMSGSQTYFDVYINGNKVNQTSLNLMNNTNENFDFKNLFKMPTKEFLKPSFELTLGKNLYQLTPKLNKGIHTLRLIKRNETISNPSQIHGFIIDSLATLMPMKPKKLKLEFIGDSYTVGYGNASPIEKLRGNINGFDQDPTSRNCTDKELSLYTNSSLNYATQVSRQLNASYQINSISGIGVARNYNGSKSLEPLINYYNQSIISDRTSNYDDNFKPDVIIIALGTNDFSTVLQDHEITQYPTREDLYKAFQKKYILFIEMLRTKHPGVQFLLVANNSWPDNEQRNQVREIVQHELINSKSDIHSIDLDHLMGLGCHWHPGLKTHKEWSLQIERKIEEILGL